MTSPSIFAPDRAAGLSRETASAKLREWLEWHGYPDAAAEVYTFARRNPWRPLWLCLTHCPKMPPQRGRVR